MTDTGSTGGRLRCINDHVYAIITYAFILSALVASFSDTELDFLTTLSYAANIHFLVDRFIWPMGA